MQSKLEQLQATVLDKCSTSHFDNDETFYVKIVALNEIYNFVAENILINYKLSFLLLTM